MTTRKPSPLLSRTGLLLALSLGARAALAEGVHEGADRGAASPSDPAASRKDEPDPRVEQARQAFILGATLAAQQQWAEALNAFERSSRLRAHPVTTYNLAYCERALGHYTRSYKLFRASLSEHEARTTGILPDDLLALANAYVPELERKVGRLRVQMQPEVAPVSVDGRPLEAVTEGGATPVLTAGTRDTLGSEAPPTAAFELMIDPGRHVFVVSRAGEPDRVRVEVVEEGSARDLVLDTSVRPRAPEASPARSEKSAAKSPVPMVVAYGVGGAGLVVGTVFGIMALGNKSVLDEHCSSPSACDRRYQGDVDALKRNALIADIGFGVGLLGAGVGTYFLFTSGPNDSKSRAASAPRVHAWIGVRGAGVRGVF